MQPLKRTLTIIVATGMLLTACASRHLEDAKAVYKTVKPSVVKVFVKSGDEFHFSGTGTAIESATPLILTAKHVIEDSEYKTQEAKIVTPDGKTYDVNVVYKGSKVDIAFLAPKKDAWTLPTLKLAKDNPEIGTTIYLIGHPSPGPMIHEYTLAIGVINNYLPNGFMKGGDDGDIMGYSAPTSPGNSGGALVNDKFEIVGIVKGGYLPSYSESLNYSVPVSFIQKELAKVQH